MIKLFKRLMTMQALNEIIDKLEEEKKQLELDFIEYRDRCNKAEAILIKHEETIRDQRTKITMLEHMKAA